MIQRIKQLLAKTERTATRFAAKIGIPYISVNYYLKGQRKISLEFVEAILSTFPDVSAEWLLRGQGEMFKAGSEPKNTVSVGGSVLLSNVASEGASIGTEPKIVMLLEQMNALVDFSRINMEARIKDLEATLADKRDEIIRLHNIINKLNS